MWRKESKEYEQKTLPEIINFTGDHIEYGIAMMEVIKRWPKTMQHNLTNPSINYRAFIGHCSCAMKFAWPEYLVRRAWKELSKNQQNLANEQAEKAFRCWLKFQNKGIQQNLGGKMLF